MAIKDLVELAALIKDQRDEMLAKWRVQVRQLPSASLLDTPTINDHLPKLIDELASALRSNSSATIAEAFEGSSPEHGSQRFRDGYDIKEVVAEYNILRGCIHDLADANGFNLQGKPFTILNRVFDGAIGGAVQAFATDRALDMQNRREEYLAFVAHDLRTPLNALSLATHVLELAVTQQSMRPSEVHMVKVLRRNVQQLETLVDNVMKENASLSTEVGIKLERRSIDLWPLVEALIYDLHPVAGTNSTQLLNHVPEDLVVYADASLLRRIFQNLIANAISYTPRGQIVIDARTIDENGRVECSVSDNGSGIAEDRLGVIFNKAESDLQNEDGSGFGLGLAIVKTFVEAHDGEVTAESQLGIGATFRFTLPGRKH